MSPDGQVGTNKEPIGRSQERECPTTTSNVKKNCDVSRTNKYHRQVASRVIDVYDVLQAFQVANPATAHAIKKLLCPGTRGHKDRRTDLVEAYKSIERAIELEELYDKRC